MPRVTALIVLCLLGLLVASPANAQSAGRTFEIGEEHFLLDGEPLQIRCGELHASRVPREYWTHRLKMCKAMGLNTVCAYLFWNFHERTPGEFTWDGQADVAEFCRLAQQEGLYVLLRPGPYACAEWEMGGLPWWLLKHDDIRLRSRDPRFIAAARAYLKEVGRVLGPMQVTRGGPILMVQVENEYGFYAKDAEYMGEIRQALLDAGFDVPLFACNPVQHLRHGFRDDLFNVVNFGSNPTGGFRALRRVQPSGPLMCGEYYSGWFDTWGMPHHTGDTNRYLRDLQEMLERGASFSIYMAHGGTSFGMWAGADRPFKPDTSCYDYDAPISEAGWVTSKFRRSRELMGKHLLKGETLPEIPAQNPVMSFPETEFSGMAPLLAQLPEPIEREQPGKYEELDLARGCMLYRTTLPAGPAGRIKFGPVHDAGWVSLDGQPIGTLDRRSRKFTVQVPARDAPATLEVLVEAMGRVNFGVEVHDRKGIHGPVEYVVTGRDAVTLTGWQMRRLPLDDQMIAGLQFEPVESASSAKTPAFWRASVSIDTPADTFLDLRNCGKGVVWVNGKCLGRYWNIGPAQTLYVPGPWLKSGENEVIVLDLLGPTAPTIAGLKDAVLDQLRPELDFAGSPREKKQLNLAAAKPVAAGEFAAGDQLQVVEFDRPTTGRFFCLESLSAHGGQPFAGAAEIDLLDAAGKPLSHEGWVIAYVDSEERVREDGVAENAIDGQTANHWHTEWSRKKPAHPHQLVIDLGAPREIAALQYVPRTGAGRPGGRIKEYRLYVGDDLVLDAE